MSDVILIDGRSGAGKSELATRLAALIPDAQLVRLDDLYPGWDGLRAASRAVPLVLATSRWRAWDWDADAPGRLHVLDPAHPVIVEGVGALSRASRALASIAIWLETDDAERKRRALDRDGDTFAPHWDRWAAQEERFIADENPRRLADVIVRT
jgi:uridine kinase